MQKAEFIWMNGKLVPWDEARVHVLTHALHYGTGVFEGIRCYETSRGPAVFRLADHVKRMADSAKIYLMKLPYTEEQLSDAVIETIRANKLRECYIRPIAYYGYGEMGLNPLKNPVDVAIATYPWGTYLGEEGLRKGVKCKISSWCRLDPRVLPPLAKATANYLNSVLAKIEALQAGCEEAIVLSTNGTVCEGPGENLFLVKDGVLVTPWVAAGPLQGVTMASVKRIAGDLGIPVTEREVLREELFLADEAFFTGTAAEVTPIREIDGRTVGNGARGPITEKLQSKFFEIVRGKDPAYERWLTFVQA
ncbi:MAG: branched-chain amino acid transaminase [Candidatus Brockarchaeota archaeon]|nr:branched-chain amino acid transaminase [Candidatus Brockarchaeota archaeon]